ARLFHELGELAEAEADARAALQVLELHDLPVALPWLASVLGNVLIERGRLDEADAALQLAPRTERKLEPASLTLTRARLSLTRDRPEEALREIDGLRRRSATESAMQHPWRSVSARALAALGRL